MRNYTEEKQQNPPDEKQLHQAKREYQQELLRDLFSGRQLKYTLHQAERAIGENSNSLSGNIEADFAQLKAYAESEMIDLVEKFSRQLNNYFQEDKMPEENEALIERLQKASAYFLPKIEEGLIVNLKKLHILTDNQSVEKKIADTIEAIRNCLLYTSPSPRDQRGSRMPSSA